MQMKKITRVTSLKGTVPIPGDKSISHRAVMFGALADGTTEITNFLQGADCLSTIDCFRKMGIAIENDNRTVRVHGKGLSGLEMPADILDTGNSGTTTRILSGILAGQSFECVISGDESIQSRPMDRIINPLKMMGANISSLTNNGCAPLRIIGTPLKGIAYQSPVASAQVKSAILMAGLYADKKTSVTEPSLTRNHTELMLRQFGGHIETQNTTAVVFPHPQLEAQHIDIPGDISSAAYFIAAGLIIPDSELVIKNVGINPTRDGIIRAIQQMGGNIILDNRNTAAAETTADIIVRSSQLKGITIEGEIIPTLIDELPILAVLACFAEGTTVIKDAAELKVKESNRIDVMVQNLTAMNANVQATEDGMIIEGGHPLSGTVIHSHFDHRIAMSFTIAGMAADGVTTIQDSDCVQISYPAFYQTLESLL